MKKERLVRALDLVDDDLLEKASPERKKEKRRRSLPKLIAVACVSALLLSLCLWLFIPYSTTPPDVSRYADSRYYDVIQKLNRVTFVKPTHKNRFDRYVLNIFRGAMAEDMSDSPGEASNASSGSYREVTDNQVAGVIEADKIKRTDTHIFYLDGGTLSAYTIAGENSVRVGTYSAAFNSDWTLGKGMTYDEDCEFYLSADGKIVTWLISYYDSSARQASTCVITLDVSDPSSMTEIKRITVSGNYLSSRLVGDRLLLMTQFSVRSNVDFSDEKSFLPQIYDGTSATVLAPGDIVTPDVPNSASYTVICSMEGAALTLQGATAFLSFSPEVYVTTEHVFVTRAYTEEHAVEGVVFDRTMTEIVCIGYRGDTLERKSSVVVEGTIKNQYSIDVYEGILRVVTTTWEVPQYATQKDGSMAIFDVDVSNATSANLYCISLEDGSIVAEVIAFAPRGETVESVRFDGTMAYVCTAVVVQNTDPVFFFDLSDLSHITYKDTGVIEGYSTSLVQFGDGYLLGIGVGDAWGTLKIEVYEETADGVASVCKYELEHVSYAQDYKAYYIDREHRLLGLGISLWGKSEADAYDGYVLLHFDGFSLREILKEQVNGANESKRGVRIDEYFYLFGEGDFCVKKIF